MADHELHHWPFRIYDDGNGNFYFEDQDAGLIFERGTLEQGKYDLAVIIEEDSPEYWRHMDILSPNPSCGFQIFDELTLREWKQLVRDYIRHKRKGESVFSKWLREELYNPLGEMLYRMEWLIESTPNPDSPQEVFDDFDKAWEHERAKRPEIWR